MKKRILSAFLAFVFLLGTASLLPQGAFTDIHAFADSASEDFSYYICDDDTAAIVKYNGSKETVTIPSYIDGIKVTVVDTFAFMNSTSIKSVVIPDGVTEIGVYAFSGCKNLSNISIPKSVTLIKSSAFSGTKWLEEQSNKDPMVVVNGILVDGHKCSGDITIPSTVTCIGGWAFDYCNGITSVTIPSSVADISDGAFNSCKGLKKVTIAKGTANIGNWAFTMCENLESVNIPDSVSVIGEAAFEECRKLTSITIPKSVRTIGERAFFLCTGLKNITIPSSVTSIGGRAFLNTPWLSDRRKENPFVVVNSILIDAHDYKGDSAIPKTFKSIADCAFYADYSLTEITVPDWVSEIPKECFGACANVERVVIPSSVKSIGYHSFFGCTGLKSIIVPKTVTSIKEKSLGYYHEINADSDKKVDGFVIIGEKGSVAETYAKENQMTFVEYSRLAGAGRYATAAEISKKAFPSKADTVILAYSMNYADALAGVPLAVKENAPILLTNTKSLDSTALAEIKRLKASKVIILGGEGVIGKQVETELVQSGIKAANIKRIAGKNRFSTAATIAQQLNTKPTDVFFVYGNNFADALSVSTVAASKNAPIVYLTTNGSLHPDTAAYLATLKKAGSVKNAYVIGGTSVISDDMATKAANALGLTKATRVAGEDRFATCTAVNDTFKTSFTGNELCIATGMDFPDALAGGVYAAKNKAPLFLINGKAEKPALTDKQKAYLKAKGASSITVFGGTSVVPDIYIEKIAEYSV